jgi:hypothetical protein
MRELPDRIDDFFDVLSPLLQEDAAFPNESSAQGDHDMVSLLLEENARLRALAIQLSNLLGDLPVREWEHAMATPPIMPSACRPDDPHSQTD